MILSDSQWRTITELIKEAQRVGACVWDGATEEGLTFPTLERLAADAYLVQVDAELAHRRMVDRGGESGGMASSAGNVGATPDAPPTTNTDRRATERHTISPIDPGS